MARKRSKVDARATPAQKGASAALEPGSLSPGRKWLFRLIAISLPIFALLACELGLRVVGFGFSPGFFREWHQGDTNLSVENARFAERFFPASLAPKPEAFAARLAKPAGVRRIFVLGESAALGDPDRRFGFGSMLKAMLRERSPSQKFEVINCAMVAINSHVVRCIARDCQSREGDVWVIYMGNNEFIGPFGASTVFGNKTPPLPVVRLSIAAKSTRLGQAADKVVDTVLEQFGKGTPRPAEWKGMEFFVGQNTRHDSPSAQAVHEHFLSNLRDIVEAGQKSGALILLCTVPSNLESCEPFASLHRPALSDDELKRWNAAFDEGRQLEEQQKPGEACTAYERAAGIDSTYAALQFRLGRCELALGRLTNAHAAFRNARDFDALQFRANSTLNDIIRQVARERPANLMLVDTDALFSGEARQGIPGKDLFYEHVHLTPQGNYLIAKALAESLLTASREGKAVLMTTAPGSSERWLDLPGCLSDLGYTDYNAVQSLTSILKRLKKPPFAGQSINANQVREIEGELTTARNRVPPSRMRAVLPGLRQLCTCYPEDPDPHRNLAELLEYVTDYAAARSEWETTAKLLPQNATAFYQIGRMLEQQARAEEAISAYQQCVRRDEGYFPAQLRLGFLLAAGQRQAEAIPHLRQALRISPDSIAARMALARAFQELGKRGKAVEQAKTVLQLDPNNADAQRILSQ